MNAPVALSETIGFAPGLDEEMRNIVVIGGGFAGCAAVRRLRGRLPAGYRLVLISEESYTTFNPLLAEVVGASIFPEQIVAPLRQVAPPSEQCRFVMARVREFDASARTLTCETLAGPMRVAYDQLVLAFGNLARTDFLPGFAEHALPLKTVGDALELRNVVLRRLARIELERDAQERSALGAFVIVGGGFSGVELAGELVDVLAAVRKYYPRVHASELKVTLVQDQPYLLPEMPPSLRVAAQASLERRGVEIRLGQRAASADADSLTLANNEILYTRTLIASAGVRPHPLAQASGLLLERGRIVVEPDLSAVGFNGIWALGDCAHVRNAQDGEVCPPTAQFAVRHGALLADNILRRLCGQPTRAFRYRPRGALATVGRLNGVAEIYGVRFTGLTAWLLWRAFYLIRVPTFGRKLRIWAEWTWGMLFSADITHFRFTRSGVER